MTGSQLSTSQLAHKANNQPMMFSPQHMISAKWLLTAGGFAFAGLVLSPLALAAAARPYTETRHAGRTEAIFSYRSKLPFGYEGQQLHVRRAGRTVLDVRLPPESSWPARPGRSLALVDFDGGEPEVLLSLFTGGANCCFTWRVYRFTGGRYRGSLFNSGNPGFRLANLDHRGTPEIRSGDGRFHYLFSSGAESFYPLRIYRFKAGHLVTVTRQFPYHVRQAEIRSWRLAAKYWNSGLNTHTVLAAWAANKYLLGEGADVWPRIQRLIDDGTIESHVEANGPPYLSALRAALRRFGYLALPQNG
jgi:hypothetical protein